MFFFKRKTATERAAEAQRSRDFWVQASPQVVEDKIEETLCQIYGVKRESINDETNFLKDLDDSVGVVEAVMACEEEFDIEIPDEEAEKIETVRDLKKYILKKLGKMT
jgi:acyl carrier protein